MAILQHYQQHQSLRSKHRRQLHHFIPTTNRLALYPSPSDDYYDDNDIRRGIDVATTNNNAAIASPPSISNDSFSTSFDAYFDSNSFSTTSSQRAGEDGYSLLRRPISSSSSSFSIDDPTFDAPRLLDSIEERRRSEDVNRIWFEEQRPIQRSHLSMTKSVNTAISTTMSSVNNEVEGSTSITALGGTLAESATVDLHKRTVDTLDYHLVLRALADECTSAFGKRLVLSSSSPIHATQSMSDSQLTTANNSNHDADVDDDNVEIDEDVLIMPLTASSVRGVHRRYNAVREMERLMDMENGVIRHDFVITPGSGCGDCDRRHQQRQRQKENKAKEYANVNNEDNKHISETKNNYRGKNQDSWRIRQGVNTNNRDNVNSKRTLKVKQAPLGLPPIAGRTLDLQPILSIIDDGEVLEGPEILDVASMLELSLEVLDWAEALYDVNDGEQQDTNDDQLTNNNTGLTVFVELPKLVQSIHVDDDLLRILSNAFEKGTGRLDGTTFPSLGRLRALIRSMKRDILETVDSILASPSMRDKLAVESGGALTMEINGRLVIPIQRKYQTSVGGIVHDASRSGKTCYVEPTEVTGPTNELRRAEAELRSEESRIWRELTDMIDKHRPSIERNVACLGHLDVVMARAKLGRRLGGVIPNVETDGVVHVYDAKHPVLLLRGLSLSAVVGSDVDIGRGKNQGLILTGPNSGGKTIILVRHDCGHLHIRQTTWLILFLFPSSSYTGRNYSDFMHSWSAMVFQFQANQMSLLVSTFSLPSLLILVTCNPSMEISQPLVAIC